MEELLLPQLLHEPLREGTPRDGRAARRRWGRWGGTLAGGGEGWWPAAAAEERRRRRGAARG